jgi:cell division septation protein DedD
MASGNTKNFELKLGRAGLVIVIIGMAALLCSAFIFGVSVGKNIDTYPEKIASFPQRILALVWRPAKIRAAETTAMGDKTIQSPDKTSGELDLTYYNTLTSQKGAAKEQTIPEKKTISPIPSPAVQPKKSEEKTVVPALTPDVPSKMEKAETEETKDEIETKISAAEPAAESSGAKYSVQVASLKEKAKANQMTKKISALGFVPRIVETNISGKGKWYRIIVYGFTSKSQAQAAAEKITRKTKTSCVVKRISLAAPKSKK